MRWSFKIFRAGGTEVRLHATLLLLAAWYGWSGWRESGVAGALDELLFMGLLFLSVLLHEFGHALAARHYRIATPQILLTPIGGIASIATIPEEPRKELVIALAGPAVTLLIAVVGWGLWQVFAAPEANFMAALDAGALLPSVILTNAALLAFNLLPAFPMDGGRVLRALVASKWGYLRGTMIAARAGQAIAVVFIILGFRGNAILALIGFFVLTAAEGEYRVARARALQNHQQMIEIVDPTPPELPRG